MMNAVTPFLFFILSTSILAAPIKKWEVTKGIDTPESVYFDSNERVLYVSNVSGSPDKKDNKGWISKIGLDGSMIKEKFASGLHAPKGMRSHNGLLWVSDIDRVVAIDMKTGKIKKKISIKGARFLNDVAIASNGNVFVSDTMGSRIYVLKNGKPSIYMEGEKLSSPNGLLISGDELFVATWGLAKPDFSTDQKGSVWSVNLKDMLHIMKPFSKSGFGQLDGIEKFGDVFLVSDWVAGKVFTLKQSEEPVEILSGFKGAADIGLVESEKLLVVPVMGENRITAYQL